MIYWVVRGALFRLLFDTVKSTLQYPKNDFCGICITKYIYASVGYISVNFEVDNLTFV